MVTKLSANKPNQFNDQSTHTQDNS